MKKEIWNQFCIAVGSDHVYVDEPMSRHTTFRIGGPADYFVCPHSADEVQRILQICRKEEIPYFILGNGSNLLVSDKGYRGAIIQIYRNISSITVKGSMITVKAGALLSQVANKAQANGLTGFEFAAGIPGTMGGAVVMNAGAYGGEIKDVIKEVTVIDKESKILHLHAKDLHMGYRTSVIKEAGYTVAEAVIELSPGDKNAIQQRMDELKEQRVMKQPLEMPSAGSTFKRPKGYYAGKLIMDSGLRGFTVGGAQISEKHCGFVVNTGHATAADVKSLIEQVSARVYEKFGVILEPEVKFLGEF